MAAADDNALPDALVLPDRFDAPPPITHSRLPRWAQIVGAVALVLVSAWLPLWLVLILSAVAIAVVGFALLREDSAQPPRRAELVRLVATREPSRPVYAQLRWYSPGGPALPEISVATERGGEVEQLFGVPEGVPLGGLRVDGEPARATLLGDGEAAVLVLADSDQVVPLSLPYQPKGRKYLRPRQFGHVHGAPGANTRVLATLLNRRRTAKAAAWLADGPEWTDVRLLPVRGRWTRAVVADENGALLAHVSLPWQGRRLVTRPLAGLLAVRPQWQVDPEGPTQVEVLIYGADWPVVLVTTLDGHLR
ncbi:hypothetical protein GCM10010174_46120 [Kutzneria viridogrisea]|uniref:Uncharacterized protein n=2 Tax=Kutzneria TaxID=43356 RepID=W5WRE8_9PSEU|nr:hypothetical protein [Kutzneria albida]AHI00740.1 hypothetical protein KALB_7382 [Kutzneria albida DSM 43870]MBA8926012.1 hypothetical protein [Kutzneria viridogrisea]